MDTLKQKLDNVQLTSTFAVSFDEDAQKEGNTHQVKVTYDFTDVLVEQALKPAVKKLNIKVQGLLRSMFLTDEHMAEAIKSEYSYNVAELLAPASREYDAMKAGVKAVEAMTPEQLADYLKQVQALAKKAG